MAYTLLADEVLVAAEKNLRDLMKRAIDEQKYNEVADIAGLADAVADLHHQHTQLAVVGFSTFPRNAPSTSSAETASRQTVSTVGNGIATSRRAPSAATARPAGASKRRLNTVKYPQFERDGDRLVKIGWSKKDRRTYEHRAPRDIVMSVIRRLATATTPGKVFTIEPLLPFRDDHDQEIPVYQPYLVIKWLQHIGAVRKKGKDGYIAQGAALNNDRITQAWEALRER